MTLYTLHQYTLPDGSFDYEKYKQVQVAGNKRKLHNSWVSEQHIEYLSAYLKEKLPTGYDFGLCHGTRRGLEQEYFINQMECKVIGTEIADTASQFPNTLQWDMHDVMPKWIGNVDFIYSNALDHSYNPKKCLDAWMQCLKPQGLCIIEHSPQHEKSTELDPFGASILIMPFLISIWSEGKYGVKEILPLPQNKQEHRFIVLQNFA